MRSLKNRTTNLRHPRKCKMKYPKYYKRALRFLRANCQSSCNS
ncbi:hypothetical protein BVRB_7g174110 [Beta vulgaris subsp. vulgaris]|nr:hypothetical protein BVRB_7g174110 [Beta vulgaris subsp. vulgaris]